MFLVVGVEGDQAAASVFEGAAEVAVEAKRLPVRDVPGDRGAVTVRLVVHEVEVRESGTQLPSLQLAPGFAEVEIGVCADAVRPPRTKYV